MRVISQDGTIDMPYEEVIIQRFRSRIYFLNKNLTGVEPLNDDMQIAEYSTEEKAQKAMEMLRKKYCKYTKAICQSYCTLFDNPKVFRFPADEDVEV